MLFLYILIQNKLDFIQKLKYASYLKFNLTSVVLNFKSFSLNFCNPARLFNKKWKYISEVFSNFDKLENIQRGIYSEKVRYFDNG